MQRSGSYQPLTARMALNLAAPHTWPAAIMPALLGTSVAVHDSCELSATLVLAVLVIVVLMQSAVNTFNDYYDYVKGTDTAEDHIDPSDSVLVYNDVNPKSALRLAIGYLAAAFLLGVYAIVVAGWVPLAIALVGALFVVAYSAGRSPISYLPLGEVVSGVVMGGLIPLGVYSVLAHLFVFRVLLFSVPAIVGVGLIMMTNNTCDIERDIPAHRKTLPVVLGRVKARRLYHVLLVVWLVVICTIVGIFFTRGFIICVFMALAAYPQIKALWGNPLAPETRLQAMPQILGLNITLGAFYAAAVLCAASGVSILF